MSKSKSFTDKSIREAVEAKLVDRMPAAIKSIAQQHAHNRVYEALAGAEKPKPIDIEGPADQDKTVGAVVIVRSDDPRMTGAAPIPVHSNDE